MPTGHGLTARDSVLSFRAAPFRRPWRPRPRHQPETRRSSLRR